MLAQLFVCDERTIRAFADRGLVVKVGRNLYDLPASIMRLVPHLREAASGRGGHDAIAGLTAERARLAKEQADAVALKNRLARGEMVLAADVTARWSDVCSTIRSKMLAIPTQAAAAMPAMSRAEIDVLDRLIRAGLTELADGFENEKGATDV